MNHSMLIQRAFSMSNCFQNSMLYFKIRIPVVPGPGNQYCRMPWNFSKNGGVSHSGYLVDFFVLDFLLLSPAYLRSKHEQSFQELSSCLAKASMLYVYLIHIVHKKHNVVKNGK